MPEGKHKLVGYRMPRSSNRYVIRIVLATVIMTLAILAILPFTQALSGDPRDRTLRTVDTANLPPPEPPPPEPPPPPEEEEEPDVEDFDEPPPPLNLSQLEASLNPGVGDAIGAGFSLTDFSMKPDAASELMIFELRDLDRVPRALRRIAPIWPADVLNERVSGVVRARILIDEKGNASVLEIIETPDSRLNVPVRKAIEQWRFEPPMKDGEDVNAQYIQPIELNY